VETTNRLGGHRPLGGRARADASRVYSVEGVAVIALGLWTLAGCWKTEFSALPTDALAFEPASGGPADWRVTTFTSDLSCPDDSDPSFLLVHPEDGTTDDVFPIAVLFHSGSFDFVLAPVSTDPLHGAHYAEPGRLDAVFSTRQAFATLGMTPDPTGLEVHDGSLVSEFANRGVVTLLPPNCWGDLWHNAIAATPNTFTSDYFFREGRTSAEWAWRMASDATFRELLGVEFPIATDPARVFAIGLGEGARAVGELLVLDIDRDGDADPHPAAILVDSPFDDVGVIFDDPTDYGNAINGLQRVFPGGPDEADVGALWSGPLPARTGYVASTADPAIPVGANAPLLAALAGLPEAWVQEIDAEGHIWLDGADPALTAAALDWMLAP
jgi:hypothetical protein